MTKPKRIDLTPEELEALLERVESGDLRAGDYELIKGMAETIAYLSHLADQKGVQVARLLRALFGSTTEKRSAVLGDEEQQDPPAPLDPASAPDDEGKKRPGHGRRGAQEYTGAERVDVEHAELKPGDDCPKCERGTLYKQSPGVVVRVTSSAPFEATVYKLEKLRCGLCGEIFTAEAPSGVGSQKYDESVSSLLALLKYGTGMPFHRLERLQENLGVPLPSSTQWDLLEAARKKLEPVYDELFRQGAQGEVIHNDDTKARVLELMGKRREKLHDPPERTGLFTTGLISRLGNRTIALFFSGSRHAGENLEKLLALREAERAPPIQMCDGLGHNEPAGTQTILSNCMSHGRRRFLEVLESFPEEVRHLIDEIAKVYEVDALARERRLDDEERLVLHQEESAPVMDELKLWLEALFEEKKVEPNSTLGAAVSYMLKRWEPLTLFRRKPGAPLDNNICERALKKAILNRKNSLFFKTRHGAQVGDLFLSLIHTAELCGANAFDYLNTLLTNAKLAAKSPADWLPWNYRETLEVSLETTR